MNAHDQQVPSNEICISLDEAEHTNDGSTSSAKRLKISDINISRYEQEFVEIKEIASGTFGTVKVARHRLDGMVYAIKVIRQLFYIKKSWNSRILYWRILTLKKHVLILIFLILGHSQ